MTKKPSEKTFLIGDEEFPRWILFGDEWIELDESMTYGGGLCPECRELGYCKRGNNDFTE
jgi:hypothetical protein